MWYKGVIYGKIEEEGKMSFSIFIFIYTIHLAYLKVYKKCACNFVTQYNSSLSSFVPNFRALSHVAEKSLTEKKVYRQTNKHKKQTNIITEKAKTIHPLYTSYLGYNKLPPAGKELMIYSKGSPCH